MVKRGRGEHGREEKKRERERGQRRWFVFSESISRIKIFFSRLIPTSARRRCRLDFAAKLSNPLFGEFFAEATISFTYFEGETR